MRDRKKEVKVGLQNWSGLVGWPQKETEAKNEWNRESESRLAKEERKEGNLNLT